MNRDRAGSTAAGLLWSRRRTITSIINSRPSRRATSTIWNSQPLRFQPRPQPPAGSRTTTTTTTTTTKRFGSRSPFPVSRRTTWTEDRLQFKAMMRPLPRIPDPPPHWNKLFLWNPPWTQRNLSPSSTTVSRKFPIPKNRQSWQKKRFARFLSRMVVQRPRKNWKSTGHGSRPRELNRRLPVCCSRCKSGTCTNSRSKVLAY
mmetsp:Transcript_26004/g.54421  ORF Transcript_26004/g.54421 Transcript_26004/m.54421 type:complete len:202 (+) Transcript_26004:572-1177(+)